MDIANVAYEEDTTVEKDGLKLFLEKRATNMLSEATIDYSDEQGFSITGISQNSCQSSCCN
jgi:Fe-S cluster assembly iron-binding protein IscA